MMKGPIISRLCSQVSWCAATGVMWHYILASYLFDLHCWPQKGAINQLDGRSVVNEWWRRWKEQVLNTQTTSAARHLQSSVRIVANV